MAQTDEEKAAARRELAEAMAEGLNIYREREEERTAKEKAEKGDTDSGDKPVAKSLAERLLGR